MPRSSPVRGSLALLVTTPTYPGGISVGSPACRLTPRVGLDAGVDVHDLDVKGVFVDPVTPRGQDLAEDAAISLLVDEVGPLGQRLADLGDHDAELARRDDLVLDELDLVLQGRVEVPAGAGHGLEDADLERAARRVGLSPGSPSGACGSRTERPGALVADQQAGARRDLDPADHPLPDAEVTDQSQDDDGQEGLGRRHRRDRIRGTFMAGPPRRRSAGDVRGARLGLPEPARDRTRRRVEHRAAGGDAIANSPAAG